MSNLESDRSYSLAIMCKWEVNFSKSLQFCPVAASLSLLLMALTQFLLVTTVLFNNPSSQSENVTDLKTIISVPEWLLQHNDREAYLDKQKTYFHKTRDWIRLVPSNNILS